ncbi:hypothetical protein T459_06001 [Capsicum annuum]|uniref:FBD domain-containing protein n=1 Tax=Capsicum annuum TaxID=4072 RepID=A0A2G3A9K2_CAPAN|nr:hypothetical protein T459_06001 [Capsicum annuum]
MVRVLTDFCLRLWIFFNMTQDNKRAAVEWDRYDRISGLPRDVMYHILELLPAQDAAITGCCVNNAPYLVNLNLEYCHGTECLNIVASRLKFLIVHEKRYLNLKCFMHYRNFSVLGLDLVELEEEVDNVKYDDERSTLEKLLLSSSSSLWELYLGSCVLELLGANVAPDGLPFMLNSLWYPLTRFTLQRNGSDFLSSTVKLRVYDGSDAETVLKYLDTPTCLDGSLKELEYVTTYRFNCSKAELLFVKLLLARAPLSRGESLVRTKKGILSLN